MLGNIGLLALFTGGILLFLVTVGAVIHAIGLRLSFPGQMASIDQLRRDVAEIEKNQSHEVLAQVTKWNQEIASAKKYRAIWWAKIVVPAGWDRVELINIPKK